MSDQFDVSFDVLATLREIIRAMDLHSKQLYKRYGLTTPQLVCLKLIDGHDSISVSGVAKLASLSQATVTSIIDRLESKEYVKRIRSESDKRKVILETTEKTKEKLKDNPSVLPEEFLNKFHQLMDWEQSLILSSLQRISAMMNVEELESKLRSEGFVEEHSGTHI